jgi:hypothetical protein
MSWDDHYKRRAALKAVLDYARRHPSAGLPYDSVPAAKQVFQSRHELLLALQYDWSQALWSRIELLSLESRGPALTDAREIAKQAWEQGASANPVLRRLLDGAKDELGSAVRREQDLMASAVLNQYVA